MAKITRKYNFNRAEIEFDTNTNKYVITEIGKEDSVSYDLSSILDSFAGLSGISLSISIDDEVVEIDNEE